MTLVTVQQTIGVSCCPSAPSTRLIIIEDTYDTAPDHSLLQTPTSGAVHPHSIYLEANNEGIAESKIDIDPVRERTWPSHLSAAWADSADEALGRVISRSEPR